MSLRELEEQARARREREAKATDCGSISLREAARMVVDADDEAKLVDSIIALRGALSNTESGSHADQKYLDALAEIEAWKDASGLIDGHGDPDGITPDIARKHWEGVERERDRLRTMECRSVALDRETAEAIARHLDQHAAGLKAMEGSQLCTEPLDTWIAALRATEQESVADDSDLIDEDPKPPHAGSPYSTVRVDRLHPCPEGHEDYVLLQTAPGRLFQWHSIREAWALWHGWATEEKSVD